ncbi:MAG: hypothetical protein MMC33_010610 [Icmadophila ericetorum]|nr:hypothetical protein [Icmadophila ericetorum]
MHATSRTAKQQEEWPAPIQTSRLSIDRQHSSIHHAITYSNHSLDRIASPLRMSISCAVSMSDRTNCDQSFTRVHYHRWGTLLSPPRRHPNLASPTLSESIDGGSNDITNVDPARTRLNPIASDRNRSHHKSSRRSFQTGAQSTFFRVINPAQQVADQTVAESAAHGRILSKEHCIRTQVEAQLNDKESERDALNCVIRDNATQTEVAPLGDLAHPVKEPLLIQCGQSLDRIIEQTYQAVCTDRINFFAQAKICSFVPRGRTHDRLLFVKLQKKTWQRYSNIWKRLICFAYRTVQPDNAIQLAHRMTPVQMMAFDRMIRQAQAILDSLNDEAADGPAATGEADMPKRQDVRKYKLLDRARLSFCISLMDHKLKGDLLESTLVRFMAVLGLNPKTQGFLDAYGYTSHLSGMIKIGQMLVIQRAVTVEDDGEVEFAADLLDEMWKRFALMGSDSPFGWAIRLRAFGKQIRNCTTSLGYISWSDDLMKLTYKTPELHMNKFRRFVIDQAMLAQLQLEALMLLSSDEYRDEVVPALKADQLHDDPSNATKGWSFLHDSRGGDRWLLDRVLTHDSLRDNFIDVKGPTHQIFWKGSAAKGYIHEIDAFLERLLLLVHITSGQPARGTEILSLQHMNTLIGQHRSIFVEGGLVGTVTAYHKGYSVAGSTNIIHRYLPKEVGELVLYYLWLILPFRKKLELLALQSREGHSPFLWPKGQANWDSSRLSTVLQREARAQLHTSMNIMTYRHAAIAISRTHLTGGGFKRDYGIEDKAVDTQAAHSSWIAGSVYARGIEEAPGHVTARKEEYRQICREWHAWLGFTPCVTSLKRPLGEIPETQGSKRPRVV